MKKMLSMDTIYFNHHGRIIFPYHCFALAELLDLKTFSEEEIKRN